MMMDQKTETVAWTSRLIVDKRGAPKPLLVNAALALREAPDWFGVLAYNDFTKRTELMSPPLWEMFPATFQSRPWKAHDDLAANEWLQQNGINVSLSITEHAVEKVASENSFHPVRNYLDDLSWDRIPRLDSWISDYLGAEQSGYVSDVSRCVLIGAIARIRHPGCKVDNMPIFEGLQGIGKSTVVAALFEPFFSDEIADFGSKAAAEQVQGVWCIEVSELDAMTRGEVSKVKAFTSRRTDRFRPAYGRRVEEYPRQCVFWGTTNSDNYLKDETGGRRSWPIKCGVLDIGGLREVRDQLWAEANQLHGAGVKWWIVNPNVAKAAEGEQADRYQGDPWDDPIAEYIAVRSSVTIHELLTDAAFMHTDQQNQAAQTRVVRILQHLKWERYQIGGGDQRGKRAYRRMGTAASARVDGESAFEKKRRNFNRAAQELANMVRRDEVLQ
jgi:predicted P-loop ATPase